MVLYQLEAESYKEEFKKKCCGGNLNDLDPTDIEIKIVELELEDESV